MTNEEFFQVHSGWEAVASNLSDKFTDDHDNNIKFQPRPNRWKTTFREFPSTYAPTITGTPAEEGSSSSTPLPATLASTPAEAAPCTSLDDIDL